MPPAKQDGRAANGGGGRGQGRKPKSELYKAAIARAEKQIADKLPMLIDRMGDLAKGVTVSEIDKEGEENIYSKIPDFRALQYLTDRIMGKPSSEDEAERYGEVVNDVMQRVIAALADVDAETRESVVGKLRNK